MTHTHAPKPDHHAPPATTILQLCAADTAAWQSMPSYQDALIALGRGLCPLIVKSADRRILYRIDAPPKDRATVRISVTSSPMEPPPDAVLKP